MPSSKVLITGVAGLLGSRLASWILEHQPDVEVHGVDDLSGGYLSNVDPRVHLHVDDVAHCEPLFRLHRFDHVFHLAAYAAEALSPFVRRFNYTNNLVATAAVVNACLTHPVKRLVFTSSMSVYGRGEAPFHEDAHRWPIDPYGIAKAACEQDIEVAAEQHGLDYCIIRPHNFYGANQNIWDSYRNVLGIWMYKLLTDAPLTIFGDGSQTRAFSYVDDALPCLWRAAVEPACSGKIINLGGIEQTTILSAAQTLIEVAGRGELTFLPPRHEVKEAWPTWQRSIDLLGFEHRTQLKDGLERMWTWAQAQELRPRQVWSQLEVERGLYTYWDRATLIDEANGVTLR